jgi:hypothetical protein
MRAMDLDGALTEAEVLRHHLVGFAGGEQFEHLAFARRERGDARAGATVLAKGLARFLILFQRFLSSSTMNTVASFIGIPFRTACGAV